MKPPSEWSKADFESILYFGYYPDTKDSTLPKKVNNASQNGKITQDRSDLLERSIKCIEKTFEICIQSIPTSKTHIVPLSGGLDSRLILAALLKSRKIDNDNIKTVTFGSPHTWDFELSKQVAQSVGVKNNIIDLRSGNINWKTNDLKKATRWSGAPVPILESRVNMSIVEQFGRNDTVIWSGFFGDPSVGSHQPTNPANSWLEAIKHFINHNKIAEFEKYRTHFVPETTFPSSPFVERSVLSFEEQLDFAIFFKQKTAYVIA
jgi:hypothetical protein